MEFSSELLDYKEEFGVTQSQYAFILFEFEVGDLIKFIERHGHKVMLEKNGKCISDINVAHQHRNLGGAYDLTLFLLY